MHQHRILSIDWLKGLIVPLMIYCHVLQFFGDPATYPFVNTIIMIINVMVFPTFLFIYGRTTELAHLQKPFRRVWPRMAHQIFVLYSAFVLSGVAYRLLAEGRPMRHMTVNDVLLLQDIPGWSEFLISFALFAFVMLLGFGLWRAVSNRLWSVIALSCASLAFAALMPYDKVESVPLALIVGGTQFACFPVIPYLMYPLMGIYVQRHGMHKKWIWLMASAVMTLPGLIQTLSNDWPSRFPPSYVWVMMPALPVCALYILGEWWNRFREDKLRTVASAPLSRALGFPRDIMMLMGRHSLFFLVASNLCLFTMRGMAISPMYMKKLAFPWNQRISSPLGALSWTAVLVTALILILMIAGLRISRKTPASDT